MRVPSLIYERRDGFSGIRMHVFWDDDVTAKRGPEELLKGGCENAASLICRNWAGSALKGSLFPPATKLTLLAAAYGRGPYIFEVIDGARV